METRTETCHCVAVRFEVDLEDVLSDQRRCNCSPCRRKGAIMARVPVERLRVVAGDGAAQSRVTP